jgi:hypothetical protein
MQGSRILKLFPSQDVNLESFSVTRMMFMGPVATGQNWI